MRALKNVATPFTIAIITVAIPFTIARKTAPIPRKIYTESGKLGMFGSTDSMQDTTTPILFDVLDIRF